MTAAPYAPAGLRAAAARKAMAVYDGGRRAALNAAGYRSHRVPSPIGPLHVLEGRGDGPIPTLLLLQSATARMDHSPKRGVPE